MIDLPNEILREYDIRGTFGKNLTAEIAFSIGQRFARFLQNEHGSHVAVGYEHAVAVCLSCGGGLCLLGLVVVPRAVVAA